MKKFFIILLTIFGLHFVAVAQTSGYVLDVEIGSTKVLTWKVPGDYSGYDSLYFAVKACTTSSSCGWLVGPSKSATATYSKPYSTVVCTLYAANTAGFNSAKYFWSIYAYGSDTVAVRSGVLNLQLNGQTAVDGIATNYPVHLFAIDSSDQEPGVLIGRNSDNSTDWWSIQTLKDTMGLDSVILATLPDSLIYATRFTNDSTQSKTERDSLYTKTNQLLTPQMFGAVGDGVTEDSLAFQLMFQANYDRGGGEMYVPAGHYIISSQIDIPTDTSTSSQHFRTKVMKLTGAGSYAGGQAQLAVYNTGTFLDLRYNGGKDFKMIARGMGSLEISGITFGNLGTADSVAYLKIIATTCYIHHNAFIGTQASFAASNDAIIFGGTYLGLFPYTNGSRSTDSSAYAGYGTMITENYFDKIRRMAVLYDWTNGVSFVNNTMWNRCGTNISGGGAWESYGSEISTNPNQGGYIAGNLFEMASYYTGFKLDYSGAMNFIGNNFYDSGDSLTSFYSFNNYSSTNTVILSMQDDNATPNPVYEDATSEGTNGILNHHAGMKSYWGQPFYFRGNGYLHILNESPYWDNPDDITQQFLITRGYGTTPAWRLSYYDTTGVSVAHLFSLQYVGKTNMQLSLKGIGTIQTDSDLKLFGASSSNSVYLGSGQKVRVTEGVLYNTTTTGTAPLVISSTTPVANLTVNRIFDPSFLGDTQTDLDMNAKEITAIGKINAPGTPADTLGTDAGDYIYDPNTGQVSIVIGENLVINGDFTNWTGNGDKEDNADSWIFTPTEDTSTYYVEQSPTGEAHIVHDGTNISFHQAALDSGVTYGYSFEVTQISDTMTVDIGGSVTIGSGVYNITAIGTYSGESVTRNTQIAVKTYREGTAASITIDNLRVWLKTGGNKQVPVIPHKTPITFLTPTVNDTLFLGKWNTVRYYDSLAVFDIQNSIAIQLFYRDGSDNALFTTVDTLTTDQTLTFDTDTIPVDSKVYLYFVYIGSSEAYFRGQLYWREEK